jgi:hypothetical protein
MLQRAEDAYNVHEKRADYSLRLDHPRGREKAEGFAQVLAITGADVEYLAGVLLNGARKIQRRSEDPGLRAPERQARSALSGDRACARPWRTCRSSRGRPHGLGDPMGRRCAAFDHRLHHDYSELTMATVKHAIKENDVVALRERVGDWPAGTVGTAVSIYDDAALVEISTDVPPGATLDMLDVPFELLEIRWHSTAPPTPGMEA